MHICPAICLRNYIYRSLKWSCCVIMSFEGASWIWHFLTLYWLCMRGLNKDEMSVFSFRTLQVHTSGIKNDWYGQAEKKWYWRSLEVSPPHYRTQMITVYMRHQCCFFLTLGGIWEIWRAVIIHLPKRLERSKVRGKEPDRAYSIVLWMWSGVVCK